VRWNPIRFVPGLQWLDYSRGPLDGRDSATFKQHLIEPDICIRCNTCEETCPVHALTHDDNNYVVNAEVCERCMEYITPCPTGAIDNWRMVSKPYTTEEHFAWRAQAASSRRNSPLEHTPA
jgi:ferredoxin